MLFPKSNLLIGSGAREKVTSVKRQLFLCSFNHLLHLRPRRIINDWIILSRQGEVWPKEKYDVFLECSGKQRRAVYVDGCAIIEWREVNATVLIGEHWRLPTPALSGACDDNDLPGHRHPGKAVSQSNYRHNKMAWVKTKPPADVAGGPINVIGFTVNKIQASSCFPAPTYGTALTASAYGVSEPKQRLLYWRPMIARVMAFREVVEPGGLLPDYVGKVEALGRPPPVFREQH